MRIFIAVDIPDEAKMKLDAVIVKLKNLGGRVSWVKAKNLHLTVKFIGEYPAEGLVSLYDTLANALNGFPSGVISLADLGGFPNLYKPRVLWVGVCEGDDWFVELVKRVEDGCSKLKIPKERKKTIPHLTIGRVRDLRGADKMLEILSNTEFKYQPFDVGSITIYKSILTPRGAEYTALKKVILNGGRQ